MKVRALVPFEDAVTGVLYAVGDTFELPVDRADAAIRAGWVEAVPEAKKKKK